MEQQSCLPFYHAAVLQAQPCTTPCFGSQAGVLPLAQVAHQPAYHSSARCSTALSGDGHLLLFAGQVSQDCTLPVHDPSCPNASSGISHVSCHLVSQPQHGGHIALAEKTGPSSCSQAGRAHPKAGTYICSLPPTLSHFPLTDRQGISDGDHFY